MIRAALLLAAVQPGGGHTDDLGNWMGIGINETDTLATDHGLPASSG